MSNSQFENEACVSTFTLAYINSILYTVKDNEGNYLIERFGTNKNNFFTEASELIFEECDEFCEAWGHLFAGEEESAAQDFWATRQEISNPFFELEKWDEEYENYLGNKTHIGRTLNKAACAYKKAEVFEDDGSIAYLAYLAYL